MDRKRPPVKPGSVVTCPACEGAKQWNSNTGEVIWTKDAPGPVTKCPLCAGTGVYTHKGV